MGERGKGRWGPHFSSRPGGLLTLHSHPPTHPPTHPPNPRRQVQAREAVWLWPPRLQKLRPPRRHHPQGGAEGGWRGGGGGLGFGGGALAPAPHRARGMALAGASTPPPNAPPVHALAFSPACRLQAPRKPPCIARAPSSPTPPPRPPTPQVAEEVFQIAGRDPLIEVAIKLQASLGGREGGGGVRGGVRAGDGGVGDVSGV